MPDFELIRATATLLRTRPESYNPYTRDGAPWCLLNEPRWGDGRQANYDLIGHVLEVLLCARRIGCPSTGVTTWVDLDGLKIVLPNKLALNRLGLPEYVTRNWYRDDWLPPAQYGEGALAVADYLDAIADEYEFYETLN